MSPTPIKVYTDLSCELSCWNQIVPGRSSSSEVETALNDLPIINQRSAHNVDESEAQDILRHYRVLMDGGELIVRLRNDKALSVYIRDETAETVADIIAHVGQPEFVFGEYEGAESIKYYIYLLYPSKGAFYVVSSRPSSSSPGTEDKVEPSMVVSEAAFVAPGSLESIFTDLGQKETRAQCISDNMHPWNGYGEIKVVALGHSCP